MTFNDTIVRIRVRFAFLWQYKFFRYALLIHLAYFGISLVLVLTIFRDQNDFLIYFTAGGVFYKNINDLYEQDQYIWDFRYLPLSAVFFIPFYLLGFDLGFIMFHILNLILNFLICMLLYKIIPLIRFQDHERDDLRIIKYICIYLTAAPQMFNYILGQINLYITFFILLSLYIFLKYKDLKWEFLGSLILGLSIILKPTALILIPFLLMISYNHFIKKITFEFKRSVLRIIGLIVPNSLNLIIFWLYPKLWEGFIATNFTGSNPLTLNFSFSITKIWLNICYIYNIPFNQIYVLLIISSVVGIIGLALYIYGEFLGKFSIIYGYTFGLTIMLLVYYDSWDHHLLNLIPLLIIIIFNLPRQSEISRKYIKKPLFFLSYFDIAFMGLWFLTVQWFPFNFATTVFLILILYGISIYGLNSARGKKKGL